METGSQVVSTTGTEPKRNENLLQKRKRFRFWVCRMSLTRLSLLLCAVRAAGRDRLPKVRGLRCHPEALEIVSIPLNVSGDLSYANGFHMVKPQLGCSR